MTTAHCYTESEKEQIREMVRTGKIHSSYLKYMEQPSPPEAHTAYRAGRVTRSLATPVLIVMLLSLSFVATSRFSPTAQANTIEQVATAGPTTVTRPERHDTKLVHLISAVIARLKDQDSRIAALEGNYGDGSSIEPVETATTRVVTKKAYIRSGPSKASTPLMVISANTRLVQIGSSGEWTQVYAPSGETGWISEDVIEPAKR